MPSVERNRFGSKKKPVQPDWHKKLVPIADAAGRYQPAGAPTVIAFRNMCRHLKSFGVIVDWVTNIAGGTCVSVSWTAKDSQWSGKA